MGAILITRLEDASTLLSFGDTEVLKSLIFLLLLLLTQALEIDLKHNEMKLAKKNGIWIEDNGKKLSFRRTPRIGIDYAGEDALLPWRFIAD